jgi:hypothetical protein
MIAVHVSQSHIDRGTRDDCKACPLALAINERLKPGCYSSVGSTWITFGDAADPENLEVIRTPLSCANFASTYDATGRADAQFFTINVPRRYLRSN